MRKAFATLAGVVFAAVAALAALVPVTTAAAADDSTIWITNASDWEIHQLYISRSDEESWGADQLGDHVIAAGGGTFEIHGIPCDTWDVMMVDEDLDECVLTEVDLCASDEGWVIDNDTLLSCQSVSGD